MSKTVRFLFNDEMARAIVQGRKTVTRRPMALRDFMVSSTVGYEWEFRDRRALWNSVSTATLIERFSPCAPGDLLIGRECWGSGDLYYRGHETDPPGVIVYRADKSGRYADDTPLPKRDTDSFNWSMQKWRPSIHMPDWAARIRRRVVSVTVERLRDISEADAQREGIQDGGCETCGESSFPTPCGCANPRPVYADAFARVWDSIYAAKGLGWAGNPYVWRIEFGGPA